MAKDCFYVIHRQGVRASRGGGKLAHRWTVHAGQITLGAACALARKLEPERTGKQPPEFAYLPARSRAHYAVGEQFIPHFYNPLQGLQRSGKLAQRPGLRDRPRRIIRKRIG